MSRRWPRLAHIENWRDAGGCFGEKETLIPRKALSDTSSLLAVPIAETLISPMTTNAFSSIRGACDEPQLTGSSELRACWPRTTTSCDRASEDLMVRSSAWLSLPTSAAARSRSAGADELKLSSSQRCRESEDTIETPYNYDPLVLVNSQYLSTPEGDRQYGEVR